VKLQVDGALRRITKLELSATAGQTLATSPPPAINLEMLLRRSQRDRRTYFEVDGAAVRKH
jgi:hypothetical protein